MFACQHATNIEVIKLLVDAGADVNLTNAKGETPLYIATKSPGRGPGGADVIRYLLAHGVDPHIKNTNGRTALDFVIFADDRAGRRAAFGSLLDDYK